MAKEAFYFSHDSNARNDIKVMRLRRKMKMEGVGIYWCLIEMLRESNGYELPISSIEDIAYDLDCDENALNCVLRDFDLFEINDTHFSSKRLTRSMHEYESIIEKRRQAGVLGGKANAKQMLSKGKANVNDWSSYKLNKKKENNNPLPPKGDVISDSELEKDFNWFWEAYDKKVDRSKCEQRFKKISKAEREVMRRHLPEYVASTPDPQYRKNPLTYLNGKCWTDELPKRQTVDRTKMVY